ncbi:MAG: hypothetical protein AAGA62_03860 [Bacteroidota bacterium]
MSDYFPPRPRLLELRLTEPRLLELRLVALRLLELRLGDTLRVLRLGV